MSISIEQVLIGSSLQPQSDEVVRSAAAVAAATRAQLHLVHAYLPLAATVVETMPVVYPDERLIVEAELAAQLNRCRLAPPLLASATLEIGPPHRVIIERGIETHADLLVVGAAEGLPRLFGSTADRVLRKSTRPVLVVRPDCRVELPLRRVIFAVDLSALSAEAFSTGLALCQRFGLTPDAELEALLVIDSMVGTRPNEPVGFREVESYARQQVASFVDLHVGNAELAQRFTAVVVRDSPEAGILARLASAPPDLLVLGTHGASGFERLLLGSVAAGVVRHARCPVLVVPPEAALAGVRLDHHPRTP